MISNINKTKLFIKYFSLFFILLLLSTFTVLIFVETKIAEIQTTEIQYEEYLLLLMENKTISDEFHEIIDDLDYLRQIYNDYNDIKKHWKIFSSKNESYSKIRFIDKDGNVDTEVRYDKDDPIIIDNAYLKNIKNVNYFIKTQNLKQGQIFVSKLEFNNIGEPLIRFCTPVYDNEFKGVIVVDYSANHLFEKIREIAINSNGRIYLLNEIGECLSGNKIYNDCQIDLDYTVDASFAESYPEEWDQLDEVLFSTSHNVLNEGLEEWDTLDELVYLIDENELDSYLEELSDLEELLYLFDEDGLFTFMNVDIMNNQNVTINNLDVVFEEGMWRLVSLVEEEYDYGGYYISTNLFTIIKHIITTKYYLLAYMIVISFTITLLVIKNRLSILKIKYIYEFDPMTDVYNRRSGFMRLEKCSNKNISLCFIDINGLKEVNDKFGHNVGDELILKAVEKIKQNIRDTDFVIRLGGDEFLIVLPNLKKQEAEKVWERIAKSYEEVNASENRPYIISVSHGIQEINGVIGEEDLEKIITQADDKMYEEKKIIKRNLRIIR